MFEPDGRPADSFADTAQGSGETFDVGSPIRRDGTMNAYAANDGVVAIGGFRLSDGRPAPYSATGSGAEGGAENGAGNGAGARGVPTAAFPGDDGYAPFGLLSDGARDGSTVAMRGTSFAGAATRLVATAAPGALLAGRDPGLPRALAEGRAGSGWLSPDVARVKAGFGRVPFLPPRPVDRM